ASRLLIAAPLVPPISKSLGRRRGKVSPLRPAVKFSWQSPHPGIAALEAANRPGREPGCQPIEPGPLEHPSPKPVSQRFQSALLFRLLMELLAELNEHCGNLDFDRAGGLARAAQARGVRQMMVRCQAIIEGCEDGPDRPSIDAAV